MLPDSVWPADAEQLLWHRDPGSKRYRTRKTAGRAAAWLNTHPGGWECWQYRPGPVDPDGHVRLERRWLGAWDGVLSL